MLCSIDSRTQQSPSNSKPCFGAFVEAFISSSEQSQAVALFSSNSILLARGAKCVCMRDYYVLSQIGRNKDWILVQIAVRVAQHIILRAFDARLDVSHQISFS